MTEPTMETPMTDAPERPLHEAFVAAMGGGTDTVGRKAAEYAARHPEYMRALEELA